MSIQRIVLGLGVLAALVGLAGCATGGDGDYDAAGDAYGNSNPPDTAEPEGEGTPGLGALGAIVATATAGYLLGRHPER